MIERIGVDPNNPLPLASAVRAGDFIFLSGQAALDETGSIIAGNIIEQTELTIQRIISVLE